MFTYDENIFSDLYKDTRGFRPRGHEFFSATPLRKQAIWDDMLVEYDEEMERDRTNKLGNHRRFEELVTSTIEAGALDRATAIRWLLDAEGVDNNDPGYACHCFGLSYSLKYIFQLT